MNLTSCTLCPRNCRVDRTAGLTGFCGQTDELMVARAALHHWEEPCISGNSGSGTVFFSGCPLGCIYCQNCDIAQCRAGKSISVTRLSEIFLELQGQNACNINLVTPTHFVPQIRDALLSAKRNGLILPVVYNTGGYENVETLRELEGLVDIYLPDLKYHSPQLAEEYSHAPDYFEFASGAIAEMFRQTGSAEFTQDELPMLRRGVVVRHLLLPGSLNDSKKIIRYLYDTFGNSVYLSIMNQYTPMPQTAAHPLLKRKATAREYHALVDYAVSIGVENGFIQEGGTASESFIPAFDQEGV